MEIFKSWIEKIYWWIPTKTDQIKYGEEELENIQKEYPFVIAKMSKYTERVEKIQEKLISTFSEEQQELWLNLKMVSQKQCFEANRLKYFNERFKEIPHEINEINEITK